MGSRPWERQGDVALAFGVSRRAPRSSIPSRMCEHFSPKSSRSLASFRKLGEAHELFPSLELIEPDIVVIVVSDDKASAESVLKMLATALFHGRVMLMGSQARPGVAAFRGSVSSLG